MTKYLISFPSSAMDLSQDEIQTVEADSRRVVEDAKQAGVWVFGGGIDDTISPVRVHRDGTVTEDKYAETEHLDGGFTVLEVPSREAALDWAAKFADACRSPQEVRAFFYDPAS